MEILLTGGSGFIGKNLLESDLAKKHKIIAPSRAELDLTDGNSVAKFFANRKFDAVIHSAGKPGHRNAKDLSNIFYSDMRMFLNLLQNSGNYGKMIMLGSGAIYDQQFEIKKVKEEDYKLHLPKDEHALFRYVAADYAESLEKIIELRIFGIFGQYEDYAIRFISNAICKTLFNLPITIKQNRKFDYLYVKDLPCILDYFLSAFPRYKAYNVTPDVAVELLDLAKMIRGVAGKNISIVVEKSGLGMEYSGSNQRIKMDFPGYRLTPLTEAVERLYRWYKKNLSTIDQKKLLIDK